MSFIPSLLRVLIGAIVLLGASLFLNVSGDTGSSEALLVTGAQAKERCIKVDGKRVCGNQAAKKKKKDDDDDAKPAEAKELACCWPPNQPAGRVCGEASEARKYASSNNGGVAVTCGPYTQ